jgi:hypothetical protein
MWRQSAALLLVTFTVAASAAGQSPDKSPILGNLFDACRVSGSPDLLFVGRAEPAVVFHVSGEAEIEKARQNLVRVEAEVAHLRATLDEKTRFEREGEFQLKLVTAHGDVTMRRALYPSPYNLTFIPMQVDRAFRGVTEPTLMVLVPEGPLAPDASKMQPGERYLVWGYRADGLLPLYPEMADLGGMTAYVLTEKVMSIDAAERSMELLSSTISGATIVGTLRMHSYSDLQGSPLSDVSIVAKSDGGVHETTTTAKGEFGLMRIPEGRVQVTVLLPANMTIINKPDLTFTVRDGSCNEMYLSAGLNGRVRGRIFSPTGAPLDSVELSLAGLDHGGRPFGSHSPRSSTRGNADGTFEFSGVAPGSYVLSATHKTVVDGKDRYFTSYYPGRTDLAAAVPVVVGEATQHDGFDFFVH